MSAAPTPTWWDEHQALHTEAIPDDPSAAQELFSPAVLDLLGAVEDAFAARRDDTPQWADPHLLPDGSSRDSREEEYSRCEDPGKYRIVHARAAAWTRVLTERGWAEETTIEDPDRWDWVLEPFAAPGRMTVLRPRRAGAEPLVLARTGDAHGAHDSSDAGAVPGLVIGLGDPTAAVNETPDCGCDACDTGSRDLLEDLDRTILSIVDGSFEVTRSPEGTGMRTSFGASLGSGNEDVASPTDGLTITAGPWAEDWTSRELCPPIDPRPDQWAEEMLRQPWPARVVGGLLGALPPPLAARISALWPGHSGRRAAVVYSPGEDRPITAPLDALDQVPAGYRRIHRSARIDAMSFEDASSALLCWVLHRRAGLRVLASTTPLQQDTEVHLRWGVGPFRITAPCRVLGVIEEADRTAFSYGTLRGHPESGIEAFTLTREQDGTVRLTIDAVSRPATWYARLARPLSRLVQDRLTRRYLAALSAPRT